MFCFSTTAKLSQPFRKWMFKFSFQVRNICNFPSNFSRQMFRRGKRLWTSLGHFVAVLLLHKESVNCLRLVVRPGSSQLQMVTRPGSRGAKELFLQGTSMEWGRALQQYSPTVQAIGKSRKKEHELVRWDVWLRKELPKAYKDKGFLTKDELQIVMNWKITRGTFRPLMKLLLSNSEADVTQATRLALACLQENSSAEKKIRGSVDALCQLRGIGPATATAVLSPFVPELIPFMADEAIEGAGLERKYTLDCCCELANLLSTKARELGEEWNAELVGRAMWARGLSEVHGVDSPSEAGPEILSSANLPKPAKRKRGADEAVVSTQRKKRASKSAKP